MTESVQCYGRKKTATAVAHCKRGSGLIKLNGSPLDLGNVENWNEACLLIYLKPFDWNISASLTGVF